MATERISIQIDAKGNAEKQLNSITSSFTELNSAVELGKKAFSAISGPFISVVKEGSAFTAQLSKINAVSKEFGKNADAISKKAQEIGASTQFSALQAAKAFEEFARAGVEPEKALTQVKDAMDLAAATSSDLALSAKTVAIQMDLFKNTGIKVKDMVNLMNRTVAASPQGFDDLAMALKTSGPLAAQLDIDFNKLSTVLAGMAKSGFKGEQAGTALNAALGRLLNPVGEASKVLNELGIATDAVNPKQAELGSIFDLLNEKGLSTAQAIRLFGQEAGPKLVGLIKQGSKGLKKIEADMSKLSSASEAAEISQKGLTGSMTKFESALSGLKIAVFTKLEDQLIVIVDIASDFISWLTKNIPLAIKKVEGILDSFEDFTSYLSNTAKKVFESIETTINNVTGAFKAADAFIKGTVKTVDDALNKTVSGGLRAAANATNSVGNAAKTATNKVLNFAKSLFGAEEAGEAVDDQYVQNSTAPAIKAVGDESEKAAGKVKKLAKDLNKAAKAGKRAEKGVSFAEGLKVAGKAAGTRIASQITGVSGAIQGAEAGGPAGAIIGAITDILLANAKMQALIARLNEVIQELIDPIVEAVAPLLTELAIAIRELKPTMEVIGEMLEDYLQPLLPLVRVLGSALKEISSRIRTLNSALKDFIGGIGKEFEDLNKTLDDLASPIKLLKTPIDDLKAKIDELLQPVKDLKDKVSDLYTPVDDLRTPVNNLRAAINALASEVRELIKKFEQDENKKPSVDFNPFDGDVGFDIPGIVGGGTNTKGGSVSVGGQTVGSWHDGGDVTRGKLLRAPGMKSDEGLAVLQAGEKVIPRGGGNDSNVQYIFNINAIDPSAQKEEIYQLIEEGRITGRLGAA